MSAILNLHKVLSLTLRIGHSLLLLSFALPVGADVYRWVDGQGKTHYGDRAPQEIRAKAERVKIKSQPEGIDPEAERARQQMRALDEGRQREKAFAEQKAAQDQHRQLDLARRCQSLQNEIRDDQNTAVFFRYDDKGNRVLWTHEERLAHREQLRTLKQTYCPDVPN